MQIKNDFIIVYIQTMKKKYIFYRKTNNLHEGKLEKCGGHHWSLSKGKRAGKFAALKMEKTIN